MKRLALFERPAERTATTLWRQAQDDALRHAAETIAVFEVAARELAELQAMQVLPAGVRDLAGRVGRFAGRDAATLQVLIERARGASR